MVLDLSNTLVIGISSRALFDLETEDELFRSEGLEAYCRFQIENEDRQLEAGTGFPLVRALLNLNNLVADKRLVEVIIMSRNSADTSLRISHSVEAHGLDITRGAFTSGRSLAPYLAAFRVDLFLSVSEEDVQAAIDANFAAGLIYAGPGQNKPIEEQIRIAFDGDAVLFSEESERIFSEQGLEAFYEHERANAHRPLPEGPFARFLKTLSFLQKEVRDGQPPIRTALVTARNTPTNERVVKTLRAWGVRIDESFFLGGLAKDEILGAFGAHMYFDDQTGHCDRASSVVPTARVPHRIVATGDSE
ncbi:MAG: 5'-nucleotidase [Gammaproteobacteria bacterium]|nr:5'-nucleotidase [Gammaproteobacteria bacterium]